MTNPVPLPEQPAPGTEAWAERWIASSPGRPVPRWPNHLRWEAVDAQTVRGPAVTPTEAQQWCGCRVPVAYGGTLRLAWLLECQYPGPGFSDWRVAFGPRPID